MKKGGIPMRNQDLQGGPVNRITVGRKKERGKTWYEKFRYAPLGEKEAEPSKGKKHIISLGPGKKKMSRVFRASLCL